MSSAVDARGAGITTTAQIAGGVMAAGMYPVILACPTANQASTTLSGVWTARLGRWRLSDAQGGHENSVLV